MWTAFHPSNYVLTSLLLGPIVFTDNESVSSVLTPLESERKVLKNQPGSHETAGNYPHISIFGCFEKLSKKIPAEDESDALYLDGEVTEDSDQETDSETWRTIQFKNNADSNSNTNVGIVHPFKF
ncbi:hypothetical protein AVEN_110931-1 [Araneus ventricosus]|uniref:Uncharacterized protein n=1 Tax=Araneus ventricosus TaxID=182803 RepID=A0A4Y2VXZ1_ARAVE|nr:hypothetical protein AVEN_110931-1 [Araneus ventricosus]